MIRKLVLAISATAVTVLLLGSPAYAGRDLPTIPPHGAPFVIHHDLIPAAGPPFTLPCFGPFCSVTPFADGLAAPTHPWHMEFELEGPTLVGGNLIIAVPGGGWIRPFPALGAGDNFCIADHGGIPAGCVAGGPGIIWLEAPEVGPWGAFLSSLVAVTIGVDSSVVERPDNGDQLPTPFDFTFAPVPDPNDVFVFFEPPPEAPALGAWGVVALVLALLTTSGIVIARWRQAGALAG